MVGVPWSDANPFHCFLFLIGTCFILHLPWYCLHTWVNYFSSRTFGTPLLKLWLYLSFAYCWMIFVCFLYVYYYFLSAKLRCFKIGIIMPKPTKGECSTNICWLTHTPRSQNELWLSNKHTQSNRSA